MKVDFTGLRLQAINSFNEVITVLNKSHEANGRVIKVDPLDIVEPLDTLRESLSTLGHLFDNKGEFEALKDFELKMLQSD